MRSAVVFSFLLALPGVFAQSPKAFIGSWKMDPARSESAHQDVPEGPAVITIRQVDGGFTVETLRSEGDKPNGFHEVLRFQADGSETQSTGQGGATVSGKMHWEGPKLVIETSRNVQDSTVTTHYVHALSANGRELVIDKTLTVQHGYQFRGAATAGHGRDVFVRVSD